MADTKLADLTALTTPTVSVAESPKGLPTAITQSPMSRRSESPGLSAGSPRAAAVAAASESRALTAGRTVVENGVIVAVTQ